MRALEDLCPHCLYPLNRTIGNAETDRVIDAVSTVTTVLVSQIIGRSRMARTVAARNAAYVVLRELHDLSYPELGRIFDRDHSTVHHGAGRADPATVRRVLDLLGDDGTGPEVA